MLHLLFYLLLPAVHLLFLLFFDAKQQVKQQEQQVNSR